MGRAALRRCLSGGALLSALCLWAPANAASVVGGTSVPISTAPWSVVVEEQTSAQRSLCTGAIIAPAEVLTAAHCVFSRTGARAPLTSLSVLGGVSDFASAGPLAQVSAVRAVRVHPGYHWSSGTASDDLAILTLTSPFVLGGRELRAVTLPGPRTAYPAGARVTLAGYGRERPTQAPDGALSAMIATVDPQGSCGRVVSAAVAVADAILFCASSPTSATCNGDSGAGLVSTSSPPVLLGLLSSGAPSCAPGSHSVFTYLPAAEILRFVEGEPTAPQAPRLRAHTFVNLTWTPPLVVGATVSCSSGAWGGPVSLEYTFETATGVELQAGPRDRYLVAPRAQGAALVCRVAASNDGGTAVAETRATSAVAGVPRLTLAPAGPVRGVAGDELIVRIRFHAPRGLEGRFGACLDPPLRVGERVCSSLEHQTGGAGWFVFPLDLRIAPGLHAETVTFAVDAFAGEARAASSVRVRIAAAR